MKILKTSTLLLSAVPFALFLPGCIGDMLSPKEDPTQFFILQSADGSVRTELNSKIEINLQPTSIPTYMARNQIVTLDSESGAVSLSEIYRWAEPVRNGITRILAEDIRRADPNIGVFAYPETSPSKHPISLKVAILECAGGIGGKLNFAATWTLSFPKTGVVKPESITKDFETSQDCGDAYKTYVESINRAVSLLVDDILLELSKKIKTGRGNI